MSDNEGAIINQFLSSILRKINIPVDFHNQVKEVKTMLTDDVSGLVDSLTDFAVESATVKISIETKNDELNKIYQEWLNNINKSLAGQIQRGIGLIQKEYYKELWKASSFPVLKITKWNEIDKINFPSEMFIIDGGSIYAKEKNKGDLKGPLPYNYYIGQETKDEQKLDNGVIISRPYGRIFDKYPTPFLIKRGVLHNFLILQALADKQGEVLLKIIPYLLWIKKGTESLIAQGKGKVYSDGDLKQVVKEFQSLMDQITQKVSGLAVPIRATQFDEDITHLIPDLGKIFTRELSIGMEKRILAGLGFIDVMESVSSSRRESTLNPKVFIQLIRAGVTSFKEQILQELVYMTIDANKELHKKYMAQDIHVITSPVHIFTDEYFKNQMRLMWTHGQLSNETYCEVVGEVEYRAEVLRREKEVKSGEEITMYPHLTRNDEQYVTEEETERKGKTPKIEDKNGRPISDDKSNPDRAKEYEMSSINLETSPYKTVEDIGSKIREKLSPELQDAFMKTFNSAYKYYHNNETMAFRVAWSVIKKMGKKDKKGIWIKKTKLAKSNIETSELLTAAIQETIKEEEKVIEALLKSKNLDLMNKKSKLLDKLLKESE
jgi:cation transport regulator ChaB